MASGKEEKGHQLYRDGKYKEALLFFTEALTAAKAKPQKIALHSNRAACFLKLNDFNKVGFFFELRNGQFNSKRISILLQIFL